LTNVPADRSSGVGVIAGQLLTRLSALDLESSFYQEALAQREFERRHVP
jgi:hypothetical protein